MELLRQVVVIPPSIKEMQTDLIQNVAAYCQVSTPAELQQHSLQAQMQYYEEFIDRNPLWTAQGIYSDTGSGRSLDHREGLQSLMRKCRRGKIDLILIKSISRLGATAKRSAKSLQTGKSGTVFCEGDSQKNYTLPAVITPVSSIDSIEKSLCEAECNDMNDFEFQMLNAVISLQNVKWWRRITERKPEEFFINGFINHYPDFMIMTESDTLILLEVKGDHLWNDDSKDKLHLGRKWASAAGLKFRYFMVFKQRSSKKMVLIFWMI